MELDERVILGMLHLPGEASVQFELRGGRWLVDDPGRALRWHDGPFTVEARDLALRVAKGMEAALTLEGFEPLQVQPGARGTARLHEPARPGEVPADAPLQWEVTDVVRP